jgi:hypothetical protein
MGKQRRVQQSGRGTVTRPATVSADQVAANVMGNMRRWSRMVHGQIYANGHGHPPAAILSSLGAKGDHVLAALREAAAAVSPVAAMPPTAPIVHQVPDPGSGQ